LDSSGLAALARTRLAEPGWRRSSVTGSLDESRSLPLPESLSQAERPDSGAAWGNLLHRLLEQLVRRPELSRAELGRLAHWYCFETPELDPYVPLALDTLDQLRQTDFWSRLLRSGRRLTEVPFGVRLEESPPRLVFGVLDLVLEGEAGWEIIDYKTDRQRLEGLLERYADQVREYARHWTDLVDEPAFAGLYGLREQRLSGDLRGGAGPAGPVEKNSP
ncbi:MAG: PD-(D/E)XK nuclease family protein, partial [Vulcanimicrobiota bacterium]